MAFEEERSGQRPTLPAFKQGSLPSATQPGLLILVEKSDNSIVLAMSDGSNWLEFQSVGTL